MVGDGINKRWQRKYDHEKLFLTVVAQKLRERYIYQINDEEFLRQFGYQKMFEHQESEQMKLKHYLIIKYLILQNLKNF